MLGDPDAGSAANTLCSSDSLASISEAILSLEHET